MKNKIIAEIGINFAYGTDKNKFVDNCKKLIDLAYLSGVELVKLQKRNPDLCVPEKEKNKLKKVPWENKEITYLQYKKDIEFGKPEYDILYNYCLSKNMILFASVWDLESAAFMKQYTNIVKIPSALITNIELLEYCKNNFVVNMLSTGMSNQEEIDKAIEICNPQIVFHTNSAYPSPVDELDLGYIRYLKNKYQDNIIIGYSGHEYGISGTIAAVVMGADIVERHITLDQTLWGSDQKASLGPRGLFELVDKIKEVESMLGGNYPREVKKSELSKRESLRK
jgi:N-acetylneuraminate synthase